MLKLPNSFTDPSLNELFLHEYFNPVKNKFHVSGRKGLTKDEVITFLKALYTRENILANLDLFFPPEICGGYGIPHNDLTDIVSKIDDENLYTLGFIIISGLNTGNRISWIKNQIRVIDWSSPTSRIDCSFDRASWQMNYSFRGENFADEMKTTLRELGSNFNNIDSQYPGYWLNMESYFHGNATLASMSKFVSNRKYCVSSDHTADSLSIEMESNPSLTIRISTQNMHSCKILISNPVSKSNKAALFNTLTYNADVLDLLPWPLTVKGERNPMLYGVELEVSTEYSTRNLIEATDEPFMACKVDSSITGSMRNRVEIVTAPMSMKSHKKEWSHFFSNLDYDSFDTTIDTNNGMHVHIGRVAFNDNHLRSFAWFFGNPCNREFIVALSERKENQMHQYSAMPTWPSTYTKTGSLKSVIDHFDMLRGAVNLHKSKPTVEVRIFKGIASYATILKNLEAVDAIFFFTQQCSTTSAGLREFLNFLRKTPKNKYPVLKEFVATLDTKKMLSAAQLNDLVFNVSDPRQIVSIIHKKNFPITSHHVSLLNAKQGVRTFIFNKDSGTIEIVRTKHGKLSHLDRVLEKKYTRNNLIGRTPLVPIEPMVEPGISFAALRRTQVGLRADVGVSYYTDAVASQPPYPWTPSNPIEWIPQPMNPATDSNEVSF